MAGHTLKVIKKATVATILCIFPTPIFSKCFPSVVQCWPDSIPCQVSNMY